MNKPKPDNPWWETAILAGSFLVVWAWFLARQIAQRAPGGQLNVIWQVPLIIALAALVVVTVRRLQRVKQAFRDAQQPRPPTLFPPVNGHKKG